MQLSSGNVVGAATTQKPGWTPTTAWKNGQQIAGENELKKDTHSFTTTSLKDDEKYVFTLQAIGDNGIASPVSYPVNVLVYKKGKN